MDIAEHRSNDRANDGASAGRYRLAALRCRPSAHFVTVAGGVHGFRFGAWRLCDKAARQLVTRCRSELACNEMRQPLEAPSPAEAPQAPGMADFGASQLSSVLGVTGGDGSLAEGLTVATFLYA